MSRKRILVIEDNTRMRSLLSMLLDKEGYEVLEAEDGILGLDRARNSKPDLVLLDLRIPGMDGEEVCSSIRKDPTLAHIPIIMLTVKAHITEKLSGFRLGADDYLTKPFDTRELLARIETHLRRSMRERMTNPKTLMPGRIPVTEAIEKRIADDEAFALIRVDLDDFSSFNEVYGYDSGDEVLHIVADAVAEATADSGDPEAFVGHLGEDDFIIVTCLDSVETVCQGIIDCFETRVPSKYAPEDRKRGYFVIPDRQGNEKRVPLMTVSIGIAVRRPGGPEHVAELLSTGNEVLRYVKNLPGSNFLIDRRADSKPTLGVAPPQLESTSGISGVETG